MDLAVARGYAAVTIADITDAVGVSRRTFSNYFSGKAECVAAVIEGWFDDIVDSRSAMRRPGSRWRRCSSTRCSRVAADLPERWDRFYGLFHDEPELKAMVGAIDEASCEQLAGRRAPGWGWPRTTSGCGCSSTFGILGRPDLPGGLGAPRPTRPGHRVSPAQLELALLDHRSGSAFDAAGAVVADPARPPCPPLPSRLSPPQTSSRLPAEPPPGAR